MTAGPLGAAERSDIARRLLAGAGVRVGTLLLVRLLGVARVIVFARIFLPDEIGTLVLAMSCVAMGAALADLGFFQSVLRSRAERVPAVADTAFSLAVVLGGVTLAALYLTAPLLSELFGVDITAFVRVLAVTVLAVPLQFPRVFWQQQLRFAQPSAALLLTEVLNLAVAVGVELAFGWGVWSLVAGHVTAHLLAAAYVWALADTRPRLRLQRAEAVPVVVFGLPLMLHGLNGQIMDRVDNLAVGGIFGTAQLAYYDFAWQIPLMLAALAGTLDSMLLPVYARLEESGSDLSPLFNLANKLWSIAGSFLCIPLILFAREAVLLLYGETWLPVVPLLQVMAISFLLRFCTGYGYDNLVLVRGRTLYMMKWGIVNSILLVTVGIVMIRELGPIGGAWYWVLQALVLIPLVRLPLIRQELGSFEFARHVWQPLVAGVVAALAAVFARWAWPSTAGAIAAAAIYVVVYVVVLLRIDRGLVSRVRSILALAAAPAAARDVAHPSPV